MSSARPLSKCVHQMRDIFLFTGEPPTLPCSLFKAFWASPTRKVQAQNLFQIHVYMCSMLSKSKYTFHSCEYPVGPPLLIRKSALLPIHYLHSLVSDQVTRYVCLSQDSLFNSQVSLSILICLLTLTSSINYYGLLFKFFVPLRLHCSYLWLYFF